MIYFTYQTKNLYNNKTYVGVHSTNNINDRYLGSGIKLNKAIKKYGRHNFKREILSFFDTLEEAYLEELFIINQEWVNNPNNYTSDEVALANYHLTKAGQICSDNGMYDANYQQILDDRKPKGPFSWFESAFDSIVNFGSSLVGQGNVMGNNSSIDGCSYNGQGDRYVYYRPDCLLENNSNFMCNNISPGSQIYQSAQTVSNNIN